MAGIRDYTDRQMADATITDAINSFIALRAREWQRDQRRAILNRVFTLVDYERDIKQREPDVAAIIKKIWLNRELPPALDTE